MTDFLTEYEALAGELAQAARSETIAFGDKIDALKALTPFYVHKMKSMKPVEDSDGLPTFADFQSGIHAAGN